MITPTQQGRELRERLWQRLRSDAGPVSALTEPELRELRMLLRRTMEDDGQAGP